MPSILKQHNIIPNKESVRIPDRKPQPLDEATDTNDDFDPKESVYKDEDTEDNGSETDYQYNSSKSGKFTPTVMTREDLAEHYRSELDIICREETEKAYSDALMRKKGEIAECIKRVDTELEEMRKLQMEFAEKYAQELKYLAIEIAEKMIVQKISENDRILTRMVMKNVADVKNSAWVNVEVSERLVDLVEDLKRELEKPDYHGRATITPVAGPIDTLRINSEEGTVVADISVQAQNLRDAYRGYEIK